MNSTGEKRRICPNCGAELDATANFCPSCGAAQAPDPEVPEGPPPPIPEPGRIETPDVPGVPPPQGAASPPNYRQLLGCTGVGCGLILVAVLLAGLVVAIGGDTEEEQAASEQPAEETTEEPTEESEPSEEEEDFPPEDTRPRPRTPEERVRRNIEDALDPPPESEYKSLENLQITSRTNGCLDVYVTFKAMGILRDWSADLIETQMRQVYEGAYSDDELRGWVCTVRASASGVLTDSRGNERTETLQTTSMSGETADTVNWRNAADVDFPNIWTVEYTHPALEQQEARDALDQAIDCLDDGGLFDFDWAECP